MKIWKLLSLILLIILIGLTVVYFYRVSVNQNVKLNSNLVKYAGVKYPFSFSYPSALSFKERQLYVGTDYETGETDIISNQGYGLDRYIWLSFDVIDSSKEKGTNHCTEAASYSASVNPYEYISKEIINGNTFYKTTFAGSSDIGYGYNVQYDVLNKNVCYHFEQLSYDVGKRTVALISIKFEDYKNDFGDIEAIVKTLNFN